MTDELTPRQRLQLARLHAIAERNQVQVNLGLDSLDGAGIELFTDLTDLLEAVCRDHAAVLERLGYGGNSNV